MSPAEERRDLCASVQSDISAMLDGELDDSLVRRVLVHLEVCEHCHQFMQELQNQVGLHRELWEAAFEERSPELRPGQESSEGASVDEAFGGDLFGDVDEDPASAFDAIAGSRSSFLQKVLEDGQGRLAEIFYQLGRAYILLTVNPSFFRVLSKEPVPIPEYRLRGKAMLDGISGGKREIRDEEGQVLEGFVRAHDLLRGQLDSSESNLEKGKRLIHLCLLLEETHAAAKIWLGQYYWQKGKWVPARKAFWDVLREASRKTRAGLQEAVDPVTKVPLRIYALEHLGNVCLAEDRYWSALRIFRMVAESGAMETHSNFCTALLNLAYTNLHLDREAECLGYLEELYERFPGKRKEMGQIIGLRADFMELLSQAEPHRRMSVSCPDWFGEGAELVAHGQSLQFQFLSDDEAPSGGGRRRPGRGPRPRLDRGPADASHDEDPESPGPAGLGPR